MAFDPAPCLFLALNTQIYAFLLIFWSVRRFFEDFVRDSAGFLKNAAFCVFLRLLGVEGEKMQNLPKWQNMAKANFFLNFENILTVFVRFFGKIVALPQK